MIHRPHGRTRLSVACFVLTCALADRAFACLTTTCAVKNPPPVCVRDATTACWAAGVPLQWREPCVSFSVDARGIPSLGVGFDEAEALVTSSFALWPATECPDGFPSISVQTAGAASCTHVEYNPEGPNSNSVIFETKRWSHDPIAIGVTTVSFDADSGRIVDADIEVNLVDTALNYYGVNYVLAHEAGHFFGIDHSKDSSAVMYAQSSFSNFSKPPELGPDDRDAVCLAYPTSRAVGVCDFEPERGYSAVCGGNIEGSCAVTERAPRRPGAELLVLLTTLVAFALRSRKTRRNE